MKHIILSKKNWKNVLDESVRVLRRGGVVAYPTETSYGLGADATRKSAIAKIFAMKGRDRTKFFSVLMPSIVTARAYAHLPPSVQLLWRKFLPGPLTLIVSGKWERTIGIRVSSYPFARALVRAFGRPITATSANRSGKHALYDPGKIMRAFFFERVKPDLVIDAGVLPRRRASTVVDCTGESVRILRKGPVSAKRILRALRPMSN